MVGRNPASSKGGVLPVLIADSPGFEAAFGRLVHRRQDRAEDVEKTVRKIAERAVHLFLKPVH